MPAGTARVRVPLGPLASNRPSRISTLTLAGSGMGLRPTRDMVFSGLPDLAQYFPAHPLFAGLASGHHPARGAEDADPQPAQHRPDLMAADVDAAPGLRHPPQIADHRLVVGPVLELHPQRRVALFLVQLDLAHIPLLGEDADDLLLELRAGQLHLVVVGAHAVANAGQQVSDGIGQTHATLLELISITSSPWSRRRFRRAGHVNGSTAGTVRTCADRRAAGRRARSGGGRGWRTW